MDFLELARSRRSIRAYNGRKISREDLNLCVEAARHAPSACNSQPWKFIIADDPDTRSKIADNVFSGAYQMNAFAREAAAFIVIVAEKMKLPAWVGNKLRRTDFRKIDIGIACEHLALQAQELGIGTCILGWFNEKKLKKILFVPRTRRIELVVSMGYPGERELREKPMKDKNEVIGYNKY
ncbi:MAG: nitroreductase family protein [Candidatus Omnitrophota bacterium]